MLQLFLNFLRYFRTCRLFSRAGPSFVDILPFPAAETADLAARNDPDPSIAAKVQGLDRKPTVEARIRS
jgi:hypothetical protein